MLDTQQRSETLPKAGFRDGVPGYWFGRLFIPKMAGGETPPNPGEGDPPSGDPPAGKDGKPFDADRAQRTIDQLREEIKGLKGTSKEAETLRARLKEIEDKDKSEVERLAGTAKEAGEKLAATETALKESRLQIAAERLARKLNFHDEEDAFLHLQRSAVEYDDVGLPTNAERLLADLAKAKPHLVKAADGEPKKPAADKGTPPTPKPNGRAAPEDDEKLREQSAAHWRSRF